MRFVTGIPAWIYDFLAEDAVLVIGLAATIGITVLAVQFSKHGAAIVLCLAIVATVVASVARTAAKGDH